MNDHERLVNLAEKWKLRLDAVLERGEWELHVTPVEYAELKEMEVLKAREDALAVAARDLHTVVHPAPAGNLIGVAVVVDHPRSEPMGELGGHLGSHIWKNGAELVWECDDECPHPSHETDDG